MYNVYALYSQISKRIFLKFDNYGIWEISQTPGELLSVKNVKETEINDNELTELAIDIIEHRIYEPRLHYLLVYVPTPSKDLYVIIKYDGSIAQAEMLSVTENIKEVRRVIRNDSVGLKRRV